MGMHAGNESINIEHLPAIRREAETCELLRSCASQGEQLYCSGQ